MILMINFLFDQNPYDPDDNCLLVLNAKCSMPPIDIGRNKRFDSHGAPAIKETSAKRHLDEWCKNGEI